MTLIILLLKLIRYDLFHTSFFPAGMRAENGPFCFPFQTMTGARTYVGEPKI